MAYGSVNVPGVSRSELDSVSKLAWEASNNANTAKSDAAAAKSEVANLSKVISDIEKALAAI